MAGLNLRFSDDELDPLRERAAAEGRSMQAFAHDAVIAAIDAYRALHDPRIAAEPDALTAVEGTVFF